MYGYLAMQRFSIPLTHSVFLSPRAAHHKHRLLAGVHRTNVAPVRTVRVDEMVSDGYHGYASVSKR